MPAGNFLETVYIVQHGQSRSKDEASPHRLLSLKGIQETEQKLRLFLEVDFSVTRIRLKDKPPSK